MRDNLKLEMAVPELIVFCRSSWRTRSSNLERSRKQKIPEAAFVMGKSANVPPQPIVVAVNWDLPTAYMNQWSFGYGRELARGTGLELQYLGSHSLHLDRNYFNNTPLPGSGPINPRRPNPRFTQIRTIQNDVIATYEALSISLLQRMRSGVQLRGSYTWAHTR